MAQNADEIFVGGPDVSGAIMSAPSGTALPTTIAAALSGFSDAGYVDPSGLKFQQAGTWNPITEWGGNIVRYFQTTFQGTVLFNYLELNPVTAGVFWGAANVTTRSATGATGVQMDISINNQECPKQSFVFNMKDGLTKKARLVVPLGQPTDKGEMDFTRTTGVMLPVTLRCYPDALGNQAYLYTDDGIFTGISVPTILTASPAAQSVGKILTLTGSKFTGTTAVTVNAVSAPNFVVEADNLLVVPMPAGSAGAGNVIVTNAAGASAAFVYTRGA